MDVCLITMMLINSVSMYVNVMYSKCGPELKLRLTECTKPSIICNVLKECDKIVPKRGKPF